jgi:hypothetical protein
MFKIIDGKGFHITFQNGYTVSVQFGPGNYCDNYDERWENITKCGEAGSTTAECAVWSGDGGGMIKYSGWNDTIGARLLPKDVLELLNWAESQE